MLDQTPTKQTRRVFITSVGGFGGYILAGCSGKPDSDATTSEDTATPSPTPTARPDTDPTITSVTVGEVNLLGKLNPLTVNVRYDRLDTDKQYSIRFTTRSDAGTETVGHVIERTQGRYPGLTGFRADAPTGTATDGSAMLRYTATLREEGRDVDSEDGVVVSYE